MGAVFLSYRREDSHFATDRIYEHLTKTIDRKSIFKDVDNIPAGVNFKTHIKGAVMDSKVMLAVIGPDWLDISNGNGRRLDDPDDFVRIEIETALANNVPVIPVFVSGAHMPAKTALPASLRPLVEMAGVNVRADPDFTNDVKRLATAVKLISGAGESSSKGLIVAAAGFVAVLAVGAWLVINRGTESGRLIGKVPASAPSNCRDIPFTDASKNPPVIGSRRICD
jgi:hypothetical protein